MQSLNSSARITRYARIWLVHILVLNLYGQGCHSKEQSSFVQTSDQDDSLEVKSHQFIKNAMGTPFKITFVGLPFAQAKQLARLVFQEVERIERRVSSWRAHSDIGKLNRAEGQWSPIRAETHWLLSRAQDLNALTRGSFEITWAALKGVWNFREKRIPDPKLIQERLALIGAHHLLLQGSKRPVLSLPPSPLWMNRLEQNHPLRAELSLESTEEQKVGDTVYKARLSVGSQVDLGGIAKGYALDSASRLVRRYGAENFLIDGGGDLLAYGRSADKTAWSVGIKHPRKNEIFLTLSIPSGWSVVTSGDYERFFILAGQRYHHIIDVRNGYPSQGVVSVTLFAREATMADALATGMMILGPMDGLKVIEALDGVEAMWMTTEGEVIYSSGFKRFSLKLPTQWFEQE